MLRLFPKNLFLLGYMFKNEGGKNSKNGFKGKWHTQHMDKWQKNHDTQRCMRRGKPKKGIHTKDG